MYKKPTIAFISDALYPYNKGGKETRLYEISTRLAKRGYDVHIYCMQWWQGNANRVEDGVHLHGICPYTALYSGSRRSIRQGVLFGASCFKLLFERFDIIDVDQMPFFPLYSTRIICWIKRIPMIATWHEVWGRLYWKKYLGGVKGEIAASIEQIAVHLPDKIHSVSSMTTSRLKNELNYRGKVRTIPNGINLQLILDAQPSAQKSDLIYAGRLLKHKNVDVLLKAVAAICQNHPKIRLIIVGEGPEKKFLKKLSHELQIDPNVTFLNFTEKIQDLYSLIKSSKVFVLPSTREGFGLVLLEAAACGASVLTIDHPENAATTIISEMNGTLTSLSVSEMSENILSLLHKPKSLNYQKIRKYDWEFILDQLEKESFNKK